MFYRFITLGIMFTLTIIIHFITQKCVQKDKKKLKNILNCKSIFCLFHSFQKNIKKKIPMSSDVKGQQTSRSIKLSDANVLHIKCA